MERGRMLKIFNTLTGQKEIFEPLKPKRVGMYACGVTVYDYSHLGHARSALVFDVIRNYLRFSGYVVKYVRNFTDIDDKIINRASEEGKTWKEIAKKYLLAYKVDMKRLGVAPAWREPKATKHIKGIIRLIQTLIEKGHSYRLNGDVYYEVKTYPAYGCLSKRKAEDLLAGARVEVDERKRDPMDFALWKSSKAGEPAWDSPWGRGRPGWHIECSAMSMKHLGKTFDIHGGGMDLIFPHHENEIAQSCAATGKEFARYWVHNGFVQVNQEKMSKSLGNFFTVREIFEKWNSQWRTKDESKRDRLTAEVLRYFLLTTHYRSPLDFSDVSLQEAKSALDGFYDLFKRLHESSVETRVSDVRVKQAIEELENSFRQAMDDDFNTPAAIAALHRLRGEINRLPESGLSRQVREETVKAFRKHGKVFGLLRIRVKDWEFNPPTDWMDQGTQSSFPPQVKKWHPGYSGEITQPNTLSDEEIQEKVEERNEARRHKDFMRADAIRNELASFGIILEDRPDGTTRWKR
jgi:cysteinyl-tRNA synthetase